MAVVYRAEDTTLRRDVALKLLYPQLVRRQELSGRFLREARAAAALDHPNILKVFDVGGGEGEDAESPPYIVMELVRGRSLKEFLEEQGPPLAEVVAMIGVVLAGALEAAHRAGVIHRDVKPANVMVAEGGRLVLCDFGVARLAQDDAVVTQSGAMLGTPAFMAPEQALGKPVDARTDVYSLAATLYQLGTGALPYTGTTAAVLSAVARGELVSPLRKNPALGAPLARLIERAMAKEPAERPASAAELGAAAGELARVAGLGDPAAELRHYFAAPGEWNRRALPQIVDSQVTRARDAASRREYARALALCDRVLAIQPDHAEANSIVASVGQGARRWRRSVTLAVALCVAAAATVGGVAFVRRAGTQAVAVSAADAAPAPLPPDAAPTFVVVAPSPPDAGTVLDAGVATARVKPPRRGPPDAGAAVVVAPRSPDAGVSRPPRQTATLVVDIKPWCDLEIDGTPYGRPPKTIELPAGTHHVVCAQTPERKFEETVELAPGEKRTLRGRVVAPIQVTVALKGADAITINGIRHASGARVQVNPGKYRVVVLKNETEVEVDYVQFPTRDCTLRETPELACYE